MKIIEQTPSRMVLKQGLPRETWFILLWGSLFIGIPLLLLAQMFYGAGVTSLSCRRIEPTLVNCETRQSQAFGLLPGAPVAIPQVRAAQIYSETRSGEGGDYEVHQLRLFSPEGYFNVGSLRANRALPAAWMDQTNQFLRPPADPLVNPSVDQSRPSALHLSQDSRWQAETLLPCLFVTPFLLIGGLVMYATIQTRRLTLDKNLNRLTYEVWRLTGKQRRDLPLGLVKQIDLKEHTDSYGNRYYQPVLLPDALRAITFAHTSRQEALDLQAQIRDFLKLPLPATKLNPASMPAGPSQLCQIGNRTYTTAGLSQLPADAATQLREFDQKLRALGFEFLGDFTLVNRTPQLYGYAHSSQPIYAVIGQAAPELRVLLDALVRQISTRQPLVALSFFSSFQHGTTLSTTSNRLAIQHLKPQQIQRWSYPGLDASQLYQKHRQHLSDLQNSLGPSQRVQTDLITLTALFDDYLMRQQANWQGGLALFLNGIAAVR